MMEGGMFSPEGTFHSTRREGHGRWLHDHRHLVGLGPGRTASDDDGIFHDSEAHEEFLGRGWVRVSGSAFEIGAFTRANVELVKRLCRRAMSGQPQERFFVVAGNRLRTVRRLPTGRLDFGELDDEIPDGGTRRHR